MQNSLKRAQEMCTKYPYTMPLHIFFLYTALRRVFIQRDASYHYYYYCYYYYYYIYLCFLAHWAMTVHDTFFLQKFLTCSYIYGLFDSVHEMSVKWTYFLPSCFPGLISFNIKY
jgi:hypothetical protein